MTIGICDPVDFPRQFWVGHKRDMGSGSACDSPVDPSQNEHKRGQRRRGGIGNGTGEGRDGRLGRSYLSLRCSPEGRRTAGPINARLPAADRSNAGGSGVCTYARAWCGGWSGASGTAGQ
jgi:hypothetical protein